MVLMIGSFVVIFILAATGGLLLFYRDAMGLRLRTLVAQPRYEQPKAKSNRNRIADLVEPFERVLPKSEAEVSVVQQRLIRAGFRGESGLKTFYGAKVVVPVALCVLALVSGIGKDNALFIYLACLGVGFLIPDFWLGRKITHRQKRIRLGLPDVLDLMVVCMEAGLSMDYATARTAEELRTAQPEISDELSIVVLEQRAGRARVDAWRQLAERTDVESVRHLVSVIIQCEQLGTSIAKTLRVHSDTLRIQRTQMIEEKAAKTTVKLVFPLVFFIFPSLFLVTLGPAMIIMLDSFHKYFS